jgi:hypothetical protein
MTFLGPSMWGNSRNPSAIYVVFQYDSFCQETLAAWAGPTTVPPSLTHGSISPDLPRG